MVVSENIADNMDIIQVTNKKQIMSNSYGFMGIITIPKLQYWEHIMTNGSVRIWPNSNPSFKWRYLTIAAQDERGFCRNLGRDMGNYLMGCLEQREDKNADVKILNGVASLEELTWSKISNNTETEYEEKVFQ